MNIKNIIWFIKEIIIIIIIILIIIIITIMIMIMIILKMIQHHDR